MWQIYLHLTCKRQFVILFHGHTFAGLPKIEILFSSIILQQLYSWFWLCNSKEIDITLNRQKPDFLHTIFLNFKLTDQELPDWTYCRFVFKYFNIHNITSQNSTSQDYLGVFSYTFLKTQNAGQHFTDGQCPTPRSAVQLRDRTDVSWSGVSGRPWWFGWGVRSELGCWVRIATLGMY